MTTTPVMNAGNVVSVPGVKSAPKQMDDGASFADMFRQSAGKQRSAPDFSDSVADVVRCAPDRSAADAQRANPDAKPVRETDAKRPAEKEERTKPTQEETTAQEEAPEAQALAGAAAVSEGQALVEAVTEAVDRIAEVLGTAPEEVAAAMEDLGMTETDLFRPEKLQELFTTLAQEPDESFLLTGGELAEDFRELLGEVSQIAERIPEEAVAAEVIRIVPEEEAVPEEVYETQAAAEPMEADVDVDVEKKPLDEQYTVTVQKNGRQISYEVVRDGESGVASTEGVAEVELPKTPEAYSGDANGRNRKGNGEQSMDHAREAAMMPEPRVAQADVGAELEFVSTMEHFTTDQTQEIMDQIMDRMRVDHTGEFTKLEMQLHPESLGRVVIEIVSRNGEMTAQITTQNEAVKAAMEAQLVQLKENMSEQGLKVESVEVMVGSHAFEQSFEGQEQTGQENGTGARRPRTHRIHLGELETGGEEELTDEERMVAALMADRGGTVDYTV